MPVPRDNTISNYPLSQITFVNSVPTIALDTKPHGMAQTIEAIADLSTDGGRSLVAMLRAARNQTRLNQIGVPLDDNINDGLPEDQNKQLIANGVLPQFNLGNLIYPATGPAVLRQVINDAMVEPSAYGFYNPVTNRYESDLRTVDPLVPGSFADPDLELPPELDTVYFSDVMLPSTLSIQQAIEDVVRCNCDCWDNL